MKGVIICIIIIVVLGGILAFKIFNPSDTTSTSISKQEVLEIANKGNDCDNLYVKTIKDGKEESIKKYKNNIIILENDSLFSWQNNDTNEIITLSYKNKIALRTQKATGLVRVEKHTKQLMQYMENQEYTYKYIKDENYNNYKCIVFELNNSGNQNRNTGHILKIWLDKSTGLVVKTETKQTLDGKEVENSRIEYEVKVNILTDKDVTKPDLTGYTVTDLDNK